MIHYTLLKLLINDLVISARVVLRLEICGLLKLVFSPAGWVTIYVNIVGYEFNSWPKV